MSFLQIFREFKEWNSGDVFIENAFRVLVYLGYIHLSQEDPEFFSAATNLRDLGTLPYNKLEKLLTGEKAPGIAGECTFEETNQVCNLLGVWLEVFCASIDFVLFAKVPPVQTHHISSR